MSLLRKMKITQICVNQFKIETNGLLAILGTQKQAFELIKQMQLALSTILSGSLRKKSDKQIKFQCHFIEANAEEIVYNVLFSDKVDEESLTIKEANDQIVTIFKYQHGNLVEPADSEDWNLANPDTFGLSALTKINSASFFILGKYHEITKEVIFALDSIKILTTMSDCHSILQETISISPYSSTLEGKKMLSLLTQTIKELAKGWDYEIFLENNNIYVENKYFIYQERVPAPPWLIAAIAILSLKVNTRSLVILGSQEILSSVPSYLLAAIIEELAQHDKSIVLISNDYRVLNIPCGHRAALNLDQLIQIQEVKENLSKVGEIWIKGLQ